VQHNIEHTIVIQNTDTKNNNKNLKYTILCLGNGARSHTYEVAWAFDRACKLFNIHLYATLCFNYFRWYRRMFLYGSVFELL